MALQSATAQHDALVSIIGMFTSQPYIHLKSVMQDEGLQASFAAGTRERSPAARAVPDTLSQGPAQAAMHWTLIFNSLEVLITGQSLMLTE